MLSAGDAHNHSKSSLSTLLPRPLSAEQGDAPQPLTTKLLRWETKVPLAAGLVETIKHFRKKV
jgi:hypothetical protein